ncbi:MAG: aspartate carbamoyltransferase catalytic subunit [Oligoflexia bacterium]
MTRSLLSIAQLSAPELDALLSRTLELFEAPSSASSALRGLPISLLFYENSTRTRLSFEAAIRALGGSPQSLALSASSVQKGETLSDTALNLIALGTQGLVLRHPVAGTPKLLASLTALHGIPVLNAGDGMHAHPTQALLDAATLMHDWKGPLSGRHVLIIGDIRHSRVARSNLELLPRLGVKVTICGPGPLLPSEVELSSFRGIEKAKFLTQELLRSVDAVMVLRLQLERQAKGFFPSVTEYRHFWGLTRDRAALLKSAALILHPGPTNPGIEIDAEVMTDPRSRILKQVQIGVAARIAALEWAFASGGTA